MEIFLFRHDAYEKLYNCTEFNISSIPVEHRQHKKEAIALIFLTIVYYIFYIPCMFSLWKHKNDNTCYKLLFFIGIADLAMLWLIGLVHGWLALEGAMYCSHPTLLYFIGILVTALWMIESSADMLLSIDRCIETIAPRAWEMLFAGYRIHIWLLAICLYGLQWALFQKPALFNGMLFAWLFNPFAGYRYAEEPKFFVPLHFIHNIVNAISMPFIYLLFTIAFWHKQHHPQTHISHTNKMAFLQVFILSVLNSVASFIYVFVQFMELSQWMITFAHFDWLSVHGAPSVVFLLLNKTIRNDCRKMIKKIFDQKIVKSISSLIKHFLQVDLGQHQTIVVTPNHQNRY